MKHLDYLMLGMMMFSMFFSMVTPTAPQPLIFSGITYTMIRIILFAKEREEVKE